MQGFIRRQIPLLVRRAVTMLPAFVVIAIGVDPSKTLILSQVVLSFGSASRRSRLCCSRAPRLMGSLVNTAVTTATAVVAAAIIGPEHLPARPDVREAGKHLALARL